MRITDLLDDYYDDTIFLPEAGSPGAQQVKTAVRSKQRASRRSMRFSRAGLVAAVLTLSVSFTAVAAGWSFWDRDTARQDMDIDPDAPVSEWTEYSAPASQEDLNVVATLCSGNQVYAYLRVSPVTPEMAQAAETSEEMELDSLWELHNVTPHGEGYSCLISQLAYDSDSQTALVKVLLDGAFLSDAEEISMDLCYNPRTDGKGGETSFGSVTIPITASSELLCQPEANLDGGTLTGLHIGAGYIRVVVEAEAYDAGDLDGLVAHKRSLVEKLTPELSTVTLNFQDGTSVSLGQLESPFANWGADLEESILSMTYILSNPLDLSTLASVTIGAEGFSLTCTE